MSFLIYVFRIGRKPTLLYCAIPISLGYIITLFATEVWHLFVARFLWGVTLGPVHSIVLSMYLVEIGSIQVRGSITTLIGVLAKTGICMSYIVGAYCSMFWFGIISLSIPLLFVVTFVWMPESPYWLVANDRPDDARRSLERLRGHKNVTAELSRIQATIDESNKYEKSIFQELCAIENRRSLTIVFAFACAVILMGTEAILTYSGQIFIKVGAGFDPNILNIIFGTFLVATAILASFVIDRVGRRPLLLGSTVGLIICNFTLCVSFTLMHYEVDISSVSWIPMCACMFYIFNYGIGTATVIFTVMGEILPKHLKKLAGIVFGVTVSCLSLVISKVSQVVPDLWGYQVIFGGFLVASSLFLAFVYYKIPETKGRQLDKIFAELNKVK